MTEVKDATVYLNDWYRGDASALDQLLPLIYQELRKLAQAQIRREANPQIQCTELISEAYLRLVNVDQIEWQNRTHFFSVAAKTMRRVLVDQFRQHQAQKRGAGSVMLTYVDEQDHSPSKQMDLDRLNDAINELEQLDPRQAEIVTMKFFGGLTVDEIASVLKVSARTVKREWSMARLWLHKQISER